MKSQKIGIFGTGAIGSVMASILNEEENIILHYYNRTNYKEIKIKKGTEIIEIPIISKIIINHPQCLDWLIICLKEYHYCSAEKMLKKIIEPKTKVVVIRNGLRLKESLLAFTDENKILECIIDCSVQPIGNRYYREFNKPIVIIPNHQLGKEFKHLFTRNNISIKLSSDFKTNSWEKMCESSSLGAVLCLSGETCRIFKDKKVVNLYRNILKETITVARRDGAKIDESFETKMLTKLKAYPDEKGSSMLTDRLNNNPIELEAKNGMISKIASFYKLDTPLNDLICILLKYINKNQQK